MRGGGKQSNNVDTLPNYSNVYDVRSKLLCVHQWECCACSLFDHSATSKDFILFLFILRQMLKRIKKGFAATLEKNNISL